MTTRELVEKISLDISMQEAIAKCTTPGEAYAYAKAEGVTDSMDEFLDVMQKVKVASNEMTAADVDAVTGGTDTSDAVTVATAVVTSVGYTAIMTGIAASACGI